LPPLLPHGLRRIGIPVDFFGPAWPIFFFRRHGAGAAFGLFEYLSSPLTVPRSVPARPLPILFNNCESCLSSSTRPSHAFLWAAPQSFSPPVFFLISFFVLPIDLAIDYLFFCSASLRTLNSLSRSNQRRVMSFFLPPAVSTMGHSLTISCVSPSFDPFSLR